MASSTSNAAPVTTSSSLSSPPPRKAATRKRRQTPPRPPNASHSVLSQPRFLWFAFAATAALSSFHRFSATVDAFVAPSSRHEILHQQHQQHQHQQQHQQHQRQQRQRQQRTALGFFSILTSGGLFGDGSNNGSSDRPLAHYVDVSADYTLACTPEDYIDLAPDQRLVCVGDVHGDVSALRRFLETAGVYDPATDSWCGGNTVVVQCGDVLDRGLEELACYRLLSKLSKQAPGHHGRVVLLVGNHEALNAMGLFQYALTDAEHEECIGREVDAAIGGDENLWRKQYVGNQPARWASYEPGGLLAHSLMKNMKVAVRVGRTVCVHAGLKPEHLRDHGGIEGMNAAWRDWISLGDDLGVETGSNNNNNSNRINNPVVYNHHGQYPSDNPRRPWIEAEKRQKHYVNSIPPFLGTGPKASGPVWMRDYSSPNDSPITEATAREDLAETLLLLDADRMVIGHTIQRRINGVSVPSKQPTSGSSSEATAWRIDVGASRGCLSGSPEVLEVVKKQQQQPNESGGGTRQPTTAFVEEVHVLSALGGRIPETERLVDCYTEAALRML